MIKIYSTKCREKGIYYIKNIINNKVYIGSTRSTFYRRISHHISSLKSNTHFNYKLQKDYNKYGIKAFIFRVKPLTISDFEILQKEENLIKRIKPFYNICQEPTKGGKPNKGKKLTTNWKNNIKAKSLLYKHSEETLKKVTQNNKNNTANYIIQKDNIEITFSSLIELENYLKSKDILKTKRSKDEYYYKGWKITRTRSQKKKTKLHISNKESIIFDSSYACDKYLKMWRGATSTYLNRDGYILGLKVEYV